MTATPKVIWILVDECEPRGPQGLVYKTYKCATPKCGAMCTIPSNGDRPPPIDCEKCGAHE